MRCETCQWYLDKKICTGWGPTVVSLAEPNPMTQQVGVRILTAWPSPEAEQVCPKYEAKVTIDA